jgi:peptidoglycan/LPS O-acetylase OafA/YrhL
MRISKMNTSMNSDAGRRPPQIEALTSLRFFLAMFVLLGHWVAHFPDTIGNYNYPLFWNAPAAVSLFFILSGFVIARNYPTLATPKDRTDFIALRFIRLWPVHMITWIAMLLLAGGGKYIPFFLTMTHTWTASPFMAGAYNGPSWSIADEWFFYICFIGLAAPRTWMRILTAVAPIAIAIVLMTSLRCYLPAGSSVPVQCDSLLWVWPPTRFIEFLAGVAICRFNIRVPQVIGLALALLLLSWKFPSIPLPAGNLVSGQFAWMIQNIICGGALISSLAQSGWLSRALAIRPLIIGGEISYSMYMTHQVVNFALRDYIAELGATGSFVVTTSITIGLSLLLFYFVETPARAAMKRYLRRPRPEQKHLADESRDFPLDHAHDAIADNVRLNDRVRIAAAEGKGS